MEIAEEEPIRPDVVEVLVEFPDLRDSVEFVGVVVLAVHQELEAAHHRRQFRAGRMWRRCDMVGCHGLYLGALYHPQKQPCSSSSTIAKNSSKKIASGCGG
jgi:hypothetical protein